MTIAAAALLALSLCTAIAHAQTDLSAWPQVRIGIFVTDSNGGPLAGLTPDAFILKENGRSQTVTNLSEITEPQSVCVLIDTSGSMYKSTAIEIAAASRFIQNLPAEDEVCVASFAFQPRMEQELTMDHSLAQAAVKKLVHPTGGSAMYDAVAQTANYMQKSSRFGRRVILIFSDGVDNASNMGSGQEALNLLRTQFERNRSFVVHMIRVFNDTNETSGDISSSQKAAKALTSTGGGLPYLPRNQRELDADVDDLSQAMKSRTMLVYTTNDPAKDGRERRLEVVLDKAHGGKKMIVSAPEGYYAPSE